MACEEADARGTDAFISNDDRCCLCRAIGLVVDRDGGLRGRGKVIADVNEATLAHPTESACCPPQALAAEEV